MNTLREYATGEYVQATLKQSDAIIAIIQANIVRLVGEQVEPQQQDGQSGSFIYFSDRPTETYVVYILNKIVLEMLAGKYNKPISGLHIHDNVNTEGSVICWPQKINTVDEAKKVLSDWLGLIGSLFASDIQDINHFHQPENTHWIEDTPTQYGIHVELQ
ncbi:MAG: hypothetical protein U0518_02380 [Candidatus Gracilibacteria bacterium]